MEDEEKSTTLGSLLEALKSSDDLKHQVSLINGLRQYCEAASDGISLVVECLPTLWVDASGTMECILNKAILLLSLKCFELNASCCISHFLILSTKACSWSLRHLEASNSSTDESSLNLLFEIAIDSLRFSSALSSTLSSSLFEEKVLQLIVESFVLEQMNLTKALVAEAKKIPSVLSPTLKAVQTNLDSLIKLNRSYLEAIKCDSGVSSEEHSHASADRIRPDCNKHVLGVTVCIVQNLHDLGTVAASGGGNFAALLNASWKGVVSLLQLGKGALGDEINSGDIITTLISLALESVGLCADSWSTLESLSSSEVKRSILPIKFFLINAVRIYSEYPCQSPKVYGMAARCALTIWCLSISFCQEEKLRAACGVLAEILEPTSFLLFCSILSSPDVKHDDKLHLLDGLFDGDNKSYNSPVDSNPNNSVQEMSPVGQRVDIGGIIDAGTSSLGKMVLFLNLLKNSKHLGEVIVFDLSRKLEFVLNCLVNQDSYAGSLSLHLPLPSFCTETASTGWQPIVPYILHCLRTFMIVSTSSEPAWNEVEYFLLENLFHSHVLCSEIVIELWCFLIRNAKLDKVDDVFDGLHSLLKTIVISEPSLEPFSHLRKMARSISVIASCAPRMSIDRLYNTFIADDKSNLSFAMHVALLMEGYPLNLVSENVRIHSLQQIRESFIDYLHKSPQEISLPSSSASTHSSVLWLSAQALSCLLQHCQVDGSEMLDSMTTSQFLDFVIFVVHESMAASDGLKESYYSLLGNLLGIISNLKNIYASEEMGNVVSEIHNLFCIEPVSPTGSFYQCKASLSSFMASLCHMEIEETDGNRICCAVWALFHILLRERHWSFIHLALTSFGHFTARTTCSELWRFVPDDAALSFDIETGDTACKERFMSEFKAFLEKEMTLDVMAASNIQLNFLKKEGDVLKERVTKLSGYLADIPDSNAIKIDNPGTSKKRKMPGGVIEGLAMLQSGLKTLNDAFAYEGISEIKEEFSGHLSSLADVISNLFHLSNRD